MNSFQESLMCNNAIRIIGQECSLRPDGIGQLVEIGFGTTPPPSPTHLGLPDGGFSRPTVYFASDVHSGCIHGVGLGFGKANPDEAVLSLLSAVEGWAGYCGHFGVDYDAKDWAPISPFLLYPSIVGGIDPIGVANVRFHPIPETPPRPPLEPVKPVEQAFRYYCEELQAPYESMRPFAYHCWKALIRAAHRVNTTGEFPYDLPSVKAWQGFKNFPRGWENDRLDAVRRCLLPKASYRFVKGRGIEVSTPKVRGLIYSPYDAADFDNFREEDPYCIDLQVYWDPRGAGRVWVQAPWQSDLIAFHVDGEVPDELSGAQMKRWLERRSEKNRLALVQASAVGLIVADVIQKLSPPKKLPLALPREHPARRTAGSSASNSNVETLESLLKQAELKKEGSSKNGKSQRAVVRTTRKK